MNSFLIRLSLIAALLCGLLGSNLGAKAQHTAHRHADDEEQLQQYDSWLKHVAEEPQTVQLPLMQSGGQSHRVVTTRNSRILPSHGGKPGQTDGRWTRHHSSNSIKYALLHLRQSPNWLHTGVASPRHYYVIALRRLLC